ncbi:MAG: arylsulfatase [Cyclobacteriaceae bacterium]|nr:arylsulfatase [Cyclobacteriaceae bacterium]
MIFGLGLNFKLCASPDGVTKNYNVWKAHDLPNASLKTKLNKKVIRLFLLLILAMSWSCQSGKKPEKPNVIILYVDDLGYGDLSCYGGAIPTPNIDSLARRGVRFTDAHAPASTCTPSRYSLLTGRYAFRNKAAILPGDAPLLIDTSIVTLPKVFKSAGYATAVVGKWHLGLGYGKTDWNRKIAPGPNEIGFDYSFLIPATGDRVPTVFVKNGNVVNLDLNDPIVVDYQNPVSDKSDSFAVRIKADAQHSNTIINGVGRIGFMKGGSAAHWVDETIPAVLNEQSFMFMQSSTKPFFLFYSFHDIHVPRLPHPDFAGTTAQGARGDVIAQVDWVVGELIATLKRQNKLDNTIIIFTSDNGPVLADGYDDRAEELTGKHDAGGGLRGGKYSAYEAGTRVPTILYWKDQVEAGVSDALLTQVDLVASMASLLNVDVKEAIDSEDQLDAWLGKNKVGRASMLQESFTLAIRVGKLKYIRPFSGSTPDWLANKNVETGLKDYPQLYDLTHDLQEQVNQAATASEKVSELDKMITQIVNNELK